MELQQRNLVLASAILVTTTLGFVLLLRRNRRGETKVDGAISCVKKTSISVEKMVPPTKWLKIGKVSSLHIYPMKSGRVVNLTKAEASDAGLQEICHKRRLPLRDRVFIVYRKTSKEFISGKTYPKLFLLTVNSIDTNTVELSLENNKIIFQLPESHENNLVHMSKEGIGTTDCGEEVGNWVSQVLLGEKSGLGVGYWSGVQRKDFTDIFADYLKVYENMCNDFAGAYADIASYLIINQTSIDDLNFKINDSKNRITANNFRPNIVVEEVDEPYSEDRWEWIKIGDEATFRTFKPCTRCSVTCINPETLERSSKNEPIKTLKSYRQVADPEQKKVEGSSPVMGMYMGLHTKGKIKYGDPVFVGCS